MGKRKKKSRISTQKCLARCVRWDEFFTKWRAILHARANDEAKLTGHCGCSGFAVCNLLQRWCCAFAPVMNCFADDGDVGQAVGVRAMSVDSAQSVLIRDLGCGIGQGGWGTA